RDRVEQVEAELAALELKQLLGGEHDAGNAIVEIHPGAGGLEAQDWAEMLLRMYLRWCERRGYRTELLEHQPGEGAGLKSATFTVEGPYAYGYLKAEAGVHRLVRISPFDANARRQTSFASVLERQRQDEKMAELTKGKKEIGFGHQIRSYVLHPYRMVKDHRTGTEVGNADAVLDGEIDVLIDAYLRSQMGAEKGAAAPAAS